ILAVVPALSGGILARVAARRFGAPYAVLFQDLMSPASAQSGIPGASRARNITRALEGWVARGATKVAIVADGFRDYLESLGVEPARITRVRNWSLLPATV